jgi:D-threonate/D-erythronate kinase
VASIVGAGTGLRTRHVPLHAVTGPEGDLIGLIRAVSAEADVLVVDAITEEHLARAARAAVRADDRITWVAVDSGPASLALATALGLTAGRARHHPPVLAVSGSATTLTREQLGRLRAERTTHVVRARPDGTPPRLDVEHLTKALEHALAGAGAGEVVLLATAVEDDDVSPMSGDVAEHLPTDLATVVRDALRTCDVGGLFSSGGDVTAALLRRLGSRGLAVEGEVAPLAVAGALVGGPWNGLPVVTKGGLVGDARTTVTCVDHLIQRARIAGGRVVTADGAATPQPDSPTREDLS